MSIFVAVEEDDQVIAATVLSASYSSAFRQSVSDCCTDLISKRLRVEGPEHIRCTVNFFENSKIGYEYR